MSEEAMGETREILIFVTSGHHVSALQQSISSDMEDEDVRLLAMCGLGFVFAPGDKAFPDLHDYILLDWDNLRIIPRRTKISEIGEPGIVLLMPNAPLPELAAMASSLKQYITDGKMQHEVEKHMGQIPPEIAISANERHIGSKERPFESPQELLSFLESAQPEKYVFRGQCMEYDDKPLLPSAYRKYFRPVKFPAHLGSPPPAGVTHLDVEIVKKQSKEISDYNKGLRQTGEAKIIRGDGITGWDVLSSPPQSFSEHIIKVPYERAVECQAAGQICVFTLRSLFGQKLGMILAQQYGLTSILLDATTDPKVALFFATRESRFYWPVSHMNDLGVIYRWPRDAAMVGEDILKPLERKDFESVSSSFRCFIEQSDGLETWQDDASMIMEDKVSVKLLHIVVSGEERAFAALAFPEGSFEQSRLGRQHGAFVAPFLEPMELNPVDEQSYPKKIRLEAIWDMLKTQQGEAFYFQHSEGPLDLGPVDKFYLWPIQERSDLSLEKLASIDSSDTASAALGRVEFQDKYLELLLLLLSPWSPVQLLLWSMRSGKLQLIASPLRTLVHPGFAIHPKEARTIARRLLNKSANQGRDEYGNLTQGPITFPMGILIPSDLEREFYMSLSRINAGNSPDG